MTLTRRTPLRAQPRSKGSRAERAIVDLLRAHGWKYARRNFQSGGQGGGDIIDGPADCSLEVKHREVAKVWQWIAQCEGDAHPTDTPIVVCRCNGMDWWAIQPLDEWEALKALSADSFAEVIVRRGPGQRLSLWKDVGEAATLAGLAVCDRPRVEFWRVNSPIYVAAPFLEVLGYLKAREFGL